MRFEGRGWMDTFEGDGGQALGDGDKDGYTCNCNFGDLCDMSIIKINCLIFLSYQALVFSDL